MNLNRLQLLILSSIFTAIIGILAQITIPFPLVPITGQTLAIGLAATILGLDTELFLLYYILRSELLEFLSLLVCKVG